ncbi:zinc-dependent peptidase [Sulfitobacter sp.]|jgi:Mlc titration factor MtfA (ptsG expression regulator)|uniref:M90 family metallopeptidase n=1 Tax=Sulfitobacter sp. TaxID=1903071 RepID=UPI003EF91EE8
MPLFILLIALGVVGVLIYRAWARKQRKAQMLESALTEEEHAIIARQVPLVARMPRALRDKLEGKICLFLDQVTFQGCNGLEMTEEMELSIAAQACLLVMNTQSWYDNLTTVMVYPSAFKSKGTRTDGYVVTETETVRTGESWSRGPVILSWAHSAQGGLNADDGHNVVLHEFAHQFDDRSGRTDGVPVLAGGQSHATWVRVFREAFARHVRLTEKGARTVIDPYGATGHEEFFATAVEVFFEKSAALQEAEPDVYDQLLQLFQIDPAAWNQ